MKPLKGQATRDMSTISPPSSARHRLPPILTQQVRTMQSCIITEGVLGGAFCSPRGRSFSTSLRVKPAASSLERSPSLDACVRICRLAIQPTERDEEKKKKKSTNKAKQEKHEKIRRNGNTRAARERASTPNPAAPNTCGQLHPPVTTC